MRHAYHDQYTDGSPLPSWVDTLEPWYPLDDDGEEDVFEDNVSLLLAISCASWWSFTPQC